MSVHMRALFQVLILAMSALQISNLKKYLVKAKKEIKKWKRKRRTTRKDVQMLNRYRYRRK